jgi:hypothetical protein
MFFSCGSFRKNHSMKNKAGINERAKAIGWASIIPLNPRK